VGYFSLYTICASDIFVIFVLNYDLFVQKKEHSRVEHVSS